MNGIFLRTKAAHAKGSANNRIITSISSLEQLGLEALGISKLLNYSAEKTPL
jgi:hypothetical protein